GTAKGVTLRDLVNRQGDAAKDIHTIWERIKIESESGSTRENAERTSEVFKAERRTRLILVTSDYHMARALRIFRTRMPEMEIFTYAVSHPVSFWILWMEYWKTFFSSWGL